MPYSEHLGSSRYQDWTYQQPALVSPNGSGFPFSQSPVIENTAEENSSDSEKLTRRDFLARMGLLGIGLIAGFETAQYTQLPGEVFRVAFQHQINDYLVENPQPISLGTYGGINRVVPSQRALGTTFDRQFEFLTWHHTPDYLDHKMLLANSFLNQGRIPGFSWSIANPNNQGRFVYGSHAYYDQEHLPYLKVIAEKIRDTHIPIEIAFLEPNLRGEPPEQFTDLVRYTVDAFRKLGAHNAIFNLYLSAQFPLTLPYIKDYYPGHGVVDKFGISLYDLYLESLLAFHHWLPGNQTPIQAAWPWLGPVLEVTEGKTPVVIAETGSGRQNFHNAALWMRELMEFSRSIGVSELNLFNVNFRNKYTGDLPQTAYKYLSGDLKSKKINWGERDWSINSSQEKIDAYTEVFRNSQSLFVPDETLETRMNSLAQKIQRDQFITPTSLEKARQIDQLEGNIQA